MSLMSLLKHFGEQGNEHNGRLFWSNALGNVPFRGPHAPTLTQDEIETQVGVNFDFHSEIFDLADPEQHKRFDWIMDRIINRWFCVHHVDRRILEIDGKIAAFI